MPPHTRRTTGQNQPQQTDTAAQPPATPDQNAEQTDLIPPSGVSPDDAADLLTAIDTPAEQPKPRIACPECTPPGGLPATATAFACVHGSWDLT